MVDFNLEEEIKEGYNNKLKSQLFGLLKEREKDREWEKFLDTIITQLLGYPEEQKTINYYIIFHKITACRYLRYPYFRRNILDAINLVGKK